jgi:hypothetical protein
MEGLPTGSGVSREKYTEQRSTAGRLWGNRDIHVSVAAAGFLQL